MNKWASVDPALNGSTLNPKVNNNVLTWRPLPQKHKATSRRDSKTMWSVFTATRLILYPSKNSLRFKPKASHFWMRRWFFYFIIFFGPPEGPISTVPNPDMPRSSSSVGWEADLSAPRMANLIELEIMCLLIPAWLRKLNSCRSRRWSTSWRKQTLMCALNFGKRPNTCLRTMLTPSDCSCRAMQRINCETAKKCRGSNPSAYLWANSFILQSCAKNKIPVN